MLTETVVSRSQAPELLETIDLCSSDKGEKMEEGDIVTTPTVVQPRKEPTTEVSPADDDEEEESSGSSDDDDDDGDDDDDDGEDLFDIEELQEKQKPSRSKESDNMEEGHKEMDTSEATEEPEKIVKSKAVPTKQKTTPMVRVKKSEWPRVAKSTVPTFHIPEPVMTRARGKEKTLGE